MHHALGADQRGAQHHLVGDQAGGPVPVAYLPPLAYRSRNVGPALTAVGVVVEVGARRTHPAEAEGQLLLAAGHHGAHGIFIVGERDLGTLTHVEARTGTVRLSQAGVEMAEVRGRALGDEAGAQPAVRDLPGQLQQLR